MWNPAGGVLKELTHSPQDHYHPTCDCRIAKFTAPSPDVTGDVELGSLNPATGEETVIGRGAGTERKPTRYVVENITGACRENRTRLAVDTRTF